MRLLLLFLFLFATGAFAAETANAVKLTQRNAANTEFAPVDIPATANTVIGFNATGTLGNIPLTGNNTGDQNIFQNIVVSGQTTVSANSTTGNLTFASANGNLTITTDNTTKTITFNATGGGGGGGSGNVTNSGVLTSGNIVMGAGTTVVQATGATYSAANGGTITLGNVTITGNGTFTTNNVAAQNITLSEPVPGAAGGTGVANTGKTITIGGNFTHSGAHTLTLGTTANTNITLPTTGAVAADANTLTFTNKTFDAAGTGNVLKFKDYIYLLNPHLADGTGATLNTTATAISYGHATFSHSADEAANYVEYYFQVPEDIDTSVALRARLKILLGGADTATHRYVLSSVSVADSAVPTASTLANAINVDFAGDGSGANVDVQTSAWTTLTSWAGALTAGQTWRIRLARDGNATEDASTVNSTELGLVIEYGRTQ